MLDPDGELLLRELEELALDRVLGRLALEPGFRATDCVVLPTPEADAEEFADLFLVAGIVANSVLQG